MHVVHAHRAATKDIAIIDQTAGYVTRLIVHSIKCQKLQTKISMQFPTAPSDIFKLILLSNQKSKTKRLFICYTNDKKQQILTCKNICTGSE